MSGHDRLGVAVLRFLARRPPSDVMGEMAREVLTGRMTLHEVMRSSAYSEEFTEAAQEAVRALDAMTPEERRAAELMGEHAAADTAQDFVPTTPPTAANNTAAASTSRSLVATASARSFSSAAWSGTCRIAYAA
jgi:hypothetical protein